MAVRDTSESFRVDFVSSVGEVEAATWNALAGAGYPFLRHEFLLSLEQTGCTTSASGWQPFHALVRAGDGDGVLALMPLFVKDNSFGEYVFDWSWADAYHRHGVAYYPKLVTAIPFTPCAGPRLCVADAARRDEILAWLARRIPEEARKREVSSWHVLFPEEDVSAVLEAGGIARRTGCQYQWFNGGFRDFEHFLEKFSSRKRKNIRKERKRIAAAGIDFEVLEGRDVSRELWHTFFRFYQSTYLVRGRPPYLNRAFFERLGESMPECLLLVMARREGRYIAGALSLKGADTLYGRYWGCTEEYEFLHFETCYYQGIDYCIRHGYGRFDSGAQGEHKIQRGFEPVRTWSNHWIAHPQFEEAIGHFLKEEEGYVNEHIARAEEFLPFRQEDQG